MNGYFRIDKHTGFCFDPHIRVAKENYKPLEITFTGSSHSRSYEIKSESYDIDYDKPFYPDTNNKKTFITGISIENYSANFALSGDTVTFYLDTINVKEEIQEMQRRITHSYSKQSGR